MRHGVFTFVFKAAPTRRARLVALLASWEPDDARTPAQLGFGAVPGLHFASVTLFERPLLDPLLVIECNFDGALDDFLRDWVAAAGGLPALLSCCQDTPAGALSETLRGAAVRPKASHVGAVGLPCPEIVKSEAVVASVRTYLSGEGAALRDQPADAVATALRERFARDCPPIRMRRSPLEHAADWAPLILTVLGIAAVAVMAALSLIAPWVPSPPDWLRPFAAKAAPLTTLVAVIVVLAAIAVFRRAEDREPVREQPIEPSVEIAASKENRPGTVQNHFTSLAPLKTGPVRWLTFGPTMWVINMLAAAVFRKGKLGGIPGIHFAHWAVLDEGSSLLFVSNYDGMWESYLDDFIEKAAVGLTAVWGHVQGFPASRWLVGAGAEAEKDFKHYVRDTQTPERIWYAAYPGLTNARINSNRAIVEALLGRGRAPAAVWLARL